MAEDFEGLFYNEKEPLGWDSLARDFIFMSNNKRAARFIKNVGNYKINIEAELKEKIE